MKNRLPFHSRCRGCQSHRAFSLIEVILAIGIISFAMLPMLGMIAIGMTTFKSSLSETIQTQILQQLYAEVQQTSFANLSSVLGTVRYFDGDGLEVSPDKMAYSSVTREADQATVLDPNSSMGLSVAPRTNPAANATSRQVQILICKNADLETDKTKTLAALKALYPDRLATTTILISDMGL
jgi:uncharacterized protein (TIGR02598 family)